MGLIFYFGAPEEGQVVSLGLFGFGPEKGRLMPWLLADLTTHIMFCCHGTDPAGEFT